MPHSSITPCDVIVFGGTGGLAMRKLLPALFLRDRDDQLGAGTPTPFMRRDEIETAWAWIEPVLTAWIAFGDAPRPYPAGTAGPAAATGLIERDGRTWHEESL